MTTLPVRLELEYMLDQRRLMRDLAREPNGVINERRLRTRLRQIAEDISRQKVQELSELFGKPVRPPSQETIDEWVNAETEETLEYVKSLRETNGSQRDAADDDLVETMRKALRGQREARASSAILSLNTELIEEVARGGGSTHYRWETQGDTLVRVWHEKLQSKVKEWDKPPMGGGTKAKDRGHPGSGHGCRCWPVAIAGVTPSRKPTKPGRKKAGAAEEFLERPRRTGPEIATGYDEQFGIKTGATVAEAEKIISKLPNEHMAMWDDTGSLIFRKTSGNPDSVYMSLSEMLELVDRRLTVITHNHPPTFGTSNPMFSGGDLTSFAILQPIEARVITNTGIGAKMVVTDRAKFLLLQKPGAVAKTFKTQVGAAEAAAVRAANDSIFFERVRLENIGLSFDDFARQKAYINGYKKKAFEEFNNLGRRYGFKISRFGP